MGLRDSWLAQQWNAYTEKRRIKMHHQEQFKKMQEAIKDQNLTSISDLIDQTENNEEFIRSRYNDLLLASIRTDDIEVFKEIFHLKTNPDPNHTFYYSHVMPETSSYSSKTPILYRAIESEASEIALYLAQNQRTDTHAQASSATQFANSEKIETIYPSALGLAEEKGMKDVAIAIMHKQADELRARADQLQLDSTRIGQGPN